MPHRPPQASVSQYIFSVSVATARPDGDVIHLVRNGQSLWSIAIEYGVKINQIKLLNNLNSNAVYTGQRLLIKKSATQPAASITPSPTSSPRITPFPATPTRTGTQTPTLDPVSEISVPSGNSTLVIFLVVILLAVGLVVGLVLQDRRR